MRIPRGLRSLVLVMIMALVAAACGSTGGETTTTTAAGGEVPATTTGSGPTDPGECTTPDEIHVSTPGQPPDFVQITPYLAEALGYFDEFCLDVEHVELRDGVNAVRAMQAGETHVSYAGTVSAVNAIGGGSPILVWASPANRFDYQIIATESSGITTCEELEGSTVATNGPGGLLHSVAQMFLASCGLDINTDVDVFIGSPGDFGFQMEQGVTDAAPMHADERLIIEAERGVNFVTLGNFWEVEPDFHYISMASTIDIIEEKRDAFVRYSAALLKANRWLVDPANKDAFLEKVVELTVLDEQLAADMYDVFGTVFPTSCDEALSEDSFQRLIDVETELGNLETILTFTDIVDRSICDDGEELLS